MYTSWIAMTLVVAWGLWSALAPASVGRFYARLFDNVRRKPPSETTIRVGGIVWTVLMIFAFTFLVR